MAITFTRNYFGRHVDVYWMDLPEPGFEGAAGLEFQANTKVCSENEKINQIYANQEDILDGALEPIPDDELLVGAEIEDLTIIDRTKIFVSVNLTTAAGTERSFVVPLPLVP